MLKPRRILHLISFQVSVQITIFNCDRNMGRILLKKMCHRFLHGKHFKEHKYLKCTLLIIFLKNILLRFSRFRTIIYGRSGLPKTTFPDVMDTLTTPTNDQNLSIPYDDLQDEGINKLY